MKCSVVYPVYKCNPPGCDQWLGTLESNCRCVGCVPVCVCVCVCVFVWSAWACKHTHECTCLFTHGQWTLWSYLPIVLIPSSKLWHPSQLPLPQPAHAPPPNMPPYLKGCRCDHVDCPDPCLAAYPRNSLWGLACLVCLPLSSLSSCSLKEPIYVVNAPSTY